MKQNKNLHASNYAQASKGMGKKVVLGLSGGVDSAVSAHLLKAQGFDVHAVFMKNWDMDDLSDECAAPQDFADAQAVADALDLPLQHINLAPEYWNKVFEPFLEDYRQGLTPNPDILCNRYIKFGAFWDFAQALGADFVATGHYARVHKGMLMKAEDANKDQTYFLYAMRRTLLSRVRFPLGDLTKDKVREIADLCDLPNAQKKDSTGICFVGERDMKKFLLRFLPTKPGSIEDTKGKVRGMHDGLWFYTLGQRGGLDIGGSKDAKEGVGWYVVDKDLARNTLIVAQSPNHPLLLRNHASLMRLNWLVSPDMLRAALQHETIHARVRHRGALLPVLIDSKIDAPSLEVEFLQPPRALTPGQSVVFYAKECCLGGGVIESVR